MNFKTSACEVTPLTDFDRQLIAKLYNLQSMVKGCHRRMGSPLSPADLDEVVQDASLSAWEQRASFRGDADLDGWLYGIVRYRILDHFGRVRRRRSFMSDTGGDMDGQVDPDSANDGTSGVAQAMDESLSDLGTTLATIYRSRVVEGSTFTEISSSLKRSESLVKARFYRSLPEMRRRLESFLD